MSTDTAKPGQFFAWQRALFRQGWVRVLSHRQFKVLSAIASHADGELYAYPSPQALEAITGVKANHIREDRKALIEQHGLLVHDTTRGDRNGVRLNLKQAEAGPETNAESIPSQDESVPLQDAERPVTGSSTKGKSSRRRTPNVPSQDAEDPVAGRLYKDELSKELSKEQPSDRGATERIRPKARKAAKPASKPEQVPVPASIDTQAVRTAWSDFIEHRRQRKPAMTAKAAELQLRKLADWGPERAVAALEHSTANGWQGVFEPDGKATRARREAPQYPEPDLGPLPDAGRRQEVAHAR